MKATQRGILSAAAVFAIVFAAVLMLRAQTDNPLQPISSGDIPDTATTFFRFSDYLTNGGTFGPPWPFLMDTNAPVYALNDFAYLVDDSSITNDDDLAAALLLLIQPQDQFSRNLMSANSIDPNDTNSSGGSWTNFAQFTPFVAPSNALWLEIPTNGLDDTNVTVMLHNTIEARPYTLLTTTNLTNALSTWTPELWLFGASGDLTTTQLVRADRPLLYISARTGTASGLDIISQPLDQEVLFGDMVTFSVAAVGSGTITYQWTCNGTNLPDATNRSYTIGVVKTADAAPYAVTVSNGADTLTSRTATLTVDNGTGDPFYVRLIGPRQDYVFKKNFTYYFGLSVDFYGTTVIQGGTTIKFDSYLSEASMHIKGDLVCDTEPYNPAILTTIDDESAGEFEFFSTGYPETATNGFAYIDLSHASSASVKNLHFRYADRALTVPIFSGSLDVWDCQFAKCGAAVASDTGSNSVVRFHNALFSRCTFGVTSSDNFAIEAEHITAETTNFWSASVPPWEICLTNCIVKGTLGAGSLVSTQCTVINPSTSNFQSSAYADFYLASSSPLHRAGITNVSPALLSEFRHKSTYAPVALPTRLVLHGDLTLLPQAFRYTNGSPDIGYYYDALDYVAANLALDGCRMTVEPGTAIGIANLKDSDGFWTEIGFWVGPNSVITSRGTPDKPSIFTTTKFVQEIPELEFGHDKFVANYPFGIVSFVTADDFNQPASSVPVLDFSFTHFYLPPEDYHVAAGAYSPTYVVSEESVMFLSLKNCELHGGNIALFPSNPNDTGGGNYLGTGYVGFTNCLFDYVTFYMLPSYIDITSFMDCDIGFGARNNLFRGGDIMYLDPVPASSGDWTFTDNVFEKIHFYKHNSVPMDFDYNAYHPVTTPEILWVGESSRLLPATAAHETAFTADLPYQTGLFGKFYLPTNTPLYGAGSSLPSDAGLYQFTTRVDQKKEGSEPSGHMANIGLHYVAGTNSIVLDSDGDGIPDYIEDMNGNGTVDDNETSPALAQTISGIYDSTNSIYDDVDLSGDGLSGRIKKALGMSPLDTSNPLRLTPVTTSNEPEIATFELAVSYATLTNIGILNLNMNGLDVTLEDCIPSTNGNCLLQWNTTFEPPGFDWRALQPRIVLTGTGQDTAALTGHGGISLFYATNVLQFFQSDSMFDTNSAYLDAQLGASNANYTISIYDPSTSPRTFLFGITNSTSSGIIQEDWHLTNSVGAAFMADDVDADFDVTLLQPDAVTPLAQQKVKKTLHKIVSKECLSAHCLDGFDVAYFYTPSNSVLSSMFNHGEVWYGMQAVVDVLTFPEWPWDVYYSYFNIFGYPTASAGFPGYVTTQFTQPLQTSVTGSLYPDLTNGTTRNFYGYGHGSSTYLGSYTSDAYMDAGKLGKYLGNRLGVTNSGVTNPYRFVFLDGCSTASGKDWRRAFGIIPFSATNVAARFKLGPQAFIGWSSLTAGWCAGAIMTNGTYNMDESKALATAYTGTIQYFFLDWMSGATVAKCIQDCSNTNLVSAPFAVPGNENFVVNTGTAIYHVTAGTNTCPIWVVGHSGLTVSGLTPQDDDIPLYRSKVDR